MIAHWLDLINVDGWIPHQQILGDEAQRYPTKYTCPSTSPPQNLIPRLKWVKSMHVDCGKKSSMLGCGINFLVWVVKTNSIKGCENNSQVLGAARFQMQL
jgi:hypothetical protein